MAGWVAGDGWLGGWVAGLAEAGSGWLRCLSGDGVSFMVNFLGVDARFGEFRIKGGLVARLGKMRKMSYFCRQKRRLKNVSVFSFKTKGFHKMKRYVCRATTGDSGP